MLFQTPHESARNQKSSWWVKPSLGGDNAARQHVPVHSLWHPFPRLELMKLERICYNFRLFAIRIFGSHELLCISRRPPTMPNTCGRFIPACRAQRNKPHLPYHTDPTLLTQIAHKWNLPPPALLPPIFKLRSNPGWIDAPNE